MRGKVARSLCACVVALACCMGLVPLSAYAEVGDGISTLASDAPFTVSAGDITGPVQNGYTYTGMEYVGTETEGADSYGYIYPQMQTDLYTVTVPAQTDSITITFTEGRIAYAYDGENRTEGAYRYACGEYGDGTTGSVTAQVTQLDSGAFPAFIRVQAPYDANWSSSTLYAIAIVCGEEGGGTDPVVIADFGEAYQKTSARVAGILAQSAYAYGNEWLIVAAARGGQTIPAAYYESVVAELKANDGALHDSASTYTNYAKTILALTAAGFDSTDVGGYDLVARLADYDAVTKVGINGAAYALLALDSHAYEIPQAQEGVMQTTRAALVEFLLDKELTDGGWAWSGETADPDMTSIVLQALAPYAADESADLAADDEEIDTAAVSEATDRALAALSALQDADGGFTSWGSKNSCSASQVVIATTGLDIDPAINDAFVKDEGSALDGLLTFALEDGGFGFTDSASYDALSTQQGYCALVAYDRFTTGETALYDMTDVAFRSVDSSDEGAQSSGSQSSSTKASSTAATGDHPFAMMAGLVAVIASALLVLSWRRRTIEQK